jgi:hypothetical protein
LPAELARLKTLSDSVQVSFDTHRSLSTLRPSLTNPKLN